MDEAWTNALAASPERLAGHVGLSAAALLTALMISAPGALLIARRPKARAAALAVASLVQTIPGLALLALFYPLLLALSALSLRAFGVGFGALGFLPAWLALSVYGVLPMLRNGGAGLAGVDPAVLEAADGVGMTPAQRLWRVEIPLSAPVFMAGVRTAAVWTVGAATLSTVVGFSSLGDYIFSGLQTENFVSVLFGCLAAAAVAIVADALLGLIERGLARGDMRRAGGGAAGLLIGVALALAPTALAGPEASASRPYVIGAKNFGEQFILTRLMESRIAAGGGRTERREGLGSAVIFRALAANEIDAYVDYSGTLWSNVLGRRDNPAREVVLRESTTLLRARYGVTLLGPLGFENAYALAMPEARAQALGVRDIADLTRVAPQLALGSDLEFLARPEWAAVRDAYGLRFRATRSFTPTFMFAAARSGEADVISAFSSDGRIAADHLRVLTDSRHALPPYDAVILLAPGRANDLRLRAALAPLTNRIDVQRMREANLMVDRERDKATPEAAAAWLARATGL